MSANNSTRDSGIVKDFAPPPGPPPPVMPEGWVARFDDRYQRFYYVNLATKQSQWDKPPGTVDLPISGRVSGEGDRPPSYGDSKRNSSSRAGSDYGQQGEPATQAARPMTPQSPSHLSAPQPTSGSKSPSHGIAGRLSAFLKSHSPRPTPNYQQQQQYYGAQPGYVQQQGYYQQQGRPVYIQSSGPGYMNGPPRRAGGMGVGGAAALGAGGGLLGGLLLADAFDGNDGYQDGFQDGADFGGDYGGGDDFGGGDF